MLFVIFRQSLVLSRMRSEIFYKIKEDNREKRIFAGILSIAVEWLDTKENKIEEKNCGVQTN